MPPKRARATARARSRARAPSTSPPVVRIVVADSLPIDRSSMVVMLGTQPDFSVVGEAADTREAAALCVRLKPSLIVFALRLGGDDARNPLAALRAAAPGTPVLAVAERGEGECLVLNRPGSSRTDQAHAHCATGTDCLQLAVLGGAAGTIRRSSTPHELFQAIRTVASGRSWFESGTASSIIRHALAGDGGRTDAPLSSRELEVAELIADGRSNKEISSSLGISEPTVKKHVGRILAKLGLQDRLQVGLYVARHPVMLLPLRKTPS